MNQIDQTGEAGFRKLDLRGDRSPHPMMNKPRSVKKAMPSISF